MGGNRERDLFYGGGFYFGVHLYVLVFLALPKIFPFTHLILPVIRDAQEERLVVKIARGNTHCATNTPPSGFIVLCF